MGFQRGTNQEENSEQKMSGWSMDMDFGIVDVRDDLKAWRTLW